MEVNTASIHKIINTGPLWCTTISAFIPVNLGRLVSFAELHEVVAIGTGSIIRRNVLVQNGVLN